MLPSPAQGTNTHLPSGVSKGSWGVQRLYFVILGPLPHDGQRTGAAPCDADDAVVGYRGQLWGSERGPRMLYRKVCGRDREQLVRSRVREEYPLSGTINREVGRFGRDFGDLDDLARHGVELDQALGSLAGPNAG